MNWLGRIKEVLNWGKRAHAEPVPAAPSVTGTGATATTVFSEGVAAYFAGNYAAALQRLEMAVAACHDAADAHYYLGLVHCKLGQIDDAIDSLVLATHFRPGYAQAWYRLALAIGRSDRREAVRCLEQAILQRADYAEAHNEMGVVTLELGDAQRAVECFEKAIAVNPGYARAHSNLGCVLFRNLGEYERGAEHIRTALGLDSHDLDAQCNDSMVLLHQGRLDSVIDVCDRLLAAEPGLDEARLNRALAMLKLGNFAQAWHDYEARKRIPANYTVRPFDFAAWNGEALGGRTLLVFAEQGLGDEMMFASCVPDVLALGARCVIECSPRLEKLFRRSFPGAVVRGALQADIDTHWLADVGPVDCQVAMGSLPGFFRRQRSDFPRHAGYLHADPERVAHWRARLGALGEGQKIGISWRGGTTRTRQSTRSMDLQEWLPLLGQAGCQIVSLQYGACGEEIEAVRRSAGVTVHEWRDAIDDYDETAALVSALDLVISVQTAVVHLAGALGTRAWVLVPAVAEWRYLESGETMPWYPSVRLFRQRQAGQWQPVVAEVAAELARQVRN